MKSFVITLLVCWFSITVLAQESVLSRNSNLRSGPSSSSKLLETLPAGTTVTVISKSPRSGYVRVTTEGHQTGWVWSRNVTEGAAVEKKEQPSGPASPPTPNSKTRVGDAQIYPRSDLTPGKPDPSVSQE